MLEGKNIVIPLRKEFSKQPVQDRKQVLGVHGIIPTGADIEYFWLTGHIAPLQTIPSDFYDEIIFTIPQVGRRGVLETLEQFVLAQKSPAQMRVLSDNGKISSISGSAPTAEGDGAFVVRARVIGSGSRQQVSMLQFLFVEEPLVPVVALPEGIISLAHKRKKRNTLRRNTTV